MFGNKKLKNDLTHLEVLVIEMGRDQKRYYAKVEELTDKVRKQQSFIDMLLSSADYKSIQTNFDFYNINEQREALKEKGYEFFNIIGNWEFWKKKD